MFSKNLDRASCTVLLIVLNVTGLGLVSSQVRAQCYGDTTHCSGWASVCGKWDAALTLPRLPGEPNSGFANIVVTRGDQQTATVLLVYSGESRWFRRFYPDSLRWSGRFQPPEGMLTQVFFCGSHAQLGDGRILFVGGGGVNNRITAYDPIAPVTPFFGDIWMCNDCFQALQTEPMSRFYPSAFTLATGKVLGLGGSDPGANTPAVYDPKFNTWTVLDRSAHCNYLTRTIHDGPVQGLFVSVLRPARRWTDESSRGRRGV